MLQRLYSICFISLPEKDKNCVEGREATVHINYVERERGVIVLPIYFYL